MNKYSIRRDLFAAAALTGLLANSSETSSAAPINDALYFADCMIRALDEPDAPDPNARATRPDLDEAELLRVLAINLGYQTTRGMTPCPIGDGATAEEVRVKSERWRDFIRRNENIEDEEAPTYPQPAGARVTSCKSCNAPIFFIKTDAGKIMPVNLGDKTSHFGTCPDADKHRKPRGSAPQPDAEPQPEAEPLELWDGDNESPSAAMAAKKARNVESEAGYAAATPVDPAKARLARMWVVASNAGLSAKPEAREARMEATNKMLLTYGRAKIRSWKDANDDNVNLIVREIEGGILKW